MEHDVIPPGEIHPPHNWRVADEAARLALSVTSADVGKYAWQQDDDTVWMLTDDTAPTWKNTSGNAVDSVNGQTGTVQIDAEDVPFAPAGGLAATDVQAALEELDTEKQAANGNLTALAGQTGAADKLSYWTAAATLALTTLTNFGRSMIASADDAAGRAVLGLGTASVLATDTDGTLAANSDALIPTQKAVKTYADQLLAAADAMVFKGVIDCSTNPNYPAADAGNLYRVSVAGKIGGGSGVNVEINDQLLCLVDGSAGGDQAAVGANWSISQGNVDGGVVGPTSSVDGNVPLFDGVSGKLIKDGGTPAALIAATGHAASSKTTIVDADELLGADSASLFGLIRVTALNLYNYIKGKTDALYVGLTGTQTIAGVKTFSSTPIYSSGVIQITGAAGSSRQVAWQTAGGNRWVASASATAEGGSNLGSNWNLNAYNDSSVLLFTPISIARATGVLTLSSPLPATSGGTGVTTSTGSGANALATSPTFTASILVNGPVKHGQYTLATLPSAGAFSAYLIDVTDATGGAKTCRSDGTNWKILNTTTTVI